MPTIHYKDFDRSSTKARIEIPPIVAEANEWLKSQSGIRVINIETLKKDEVSLPSAAVSRETGLRLWYITGEHQPS
jgi:hypothetical protein